MVIRILCATIAVLILLIGVASAQSGSVAGMVRDETGSALPGTTVQLFAGDHLVSETVTGTAGDYHFNSVPPGRYSLRLALVNFGCATRGVNVTATPRRTRISCCSSRSGRRSP